MKTRVLQLIGSFHQGGSERQAIALTRMMKAEGSFGVRMAVLNGEGVLRPEAEAITGEQINEFPLTSFYDANFFRQVHRLAGELSRQKIDIIHTHDFYTNVFGMTAATVARVPVRIASKRETTGVRTPTQELVERIAFKRANAVLANSHAVRERLVASGLSGDKARVVYNGVDLARFGSGDHSRAALFSDLGLSVPDTAPLVTMVANLRHAVKNVPMLLRVASRAVAAMPDAHFIVAGEGELENEMRRLADELGVARNVHFVGRVDNVPTLLAISTVCALTSHAEGFSNAIIEYMAAGKPVVVTDAGGAAEAVVDGETGFIVDCDDDMAMADKVVSLLKDTMRANEMGQHGRRLVAEKFSSTAQLSAVMALYEEHLRDREIYRGAPTSVTSRYFENEASHS